MENFIKNITEQIRCVKAREGIAHELEHHILDQAEAFEAAGDSHNEAVQKAVREMGDPVAIGVSLDRVHRPQTDWKMLIMTCSFHIAGLVLMYFAGGLSTYPNFFARQCLFTLGAFAVIIGIYFLDYSFIGWYAPVLYVLTTALFFLIAYTGPRVNGRIPSLQMLVYLYIPIFAGMLYQFRGSYKGLIKAIVLQIITTALTVLFSNSLMSGLNIYVIFLVMICIALNKNWFTISHKKSVCAAVIALLLLIPAFLIRIGFSTNNTGFRSQRIMGWLMPDLYANGPGYIYMRIREGLASAKLIGIADNPLPFQDGIFVQGPLLLLQLIGTYGILAGLLIILALAAFIAHALRIAIHQKNQLGLMISASCCMVFFFNCLEGILVNTGYVPMTSIQLPFLSSGGSTTFTYAVFIGLLLSIHRNEKIVAATAITKRPIWKVSIKLERKTE